MAKVSESQPNGFLFINKPAGMTSHDVVDALRRIIGIRRIGHAGTLDPFATGLLILGIGRATKELGKIIGLPKTYRATMHFGMTSTTGDITGRISRSNQVTSRRNLVTTLSKFLGSIDQIPPMYSAKKVGGKKLYELAREGKTIARKPQRITIYELRLVSFVWPRAEIEVHCSSGTYIRTLVEDIGRALGCGAYCEQLCRTAIGSWTLKESVTLSSLTPENWKEYILTSDFLSY